MRTPLLLLAALIALLAPAQAAGESQPSLEDRWDAILERHSRWGVIDGVELVAFDYGAVRRDPEWALLMRQLRETPEPRDPDARIAFWINAYNILAVELVSREYPVDSIRDIGGRLFNRVWNRGVAEVAGKERSLGEVEHDILREIADARIHGAVVCASVSCPPLRREAYRAERLDEQLDDNMRLWLNNPRTGVVVEDNGRTLRVSRIFNFFTSDFEDEAGSIWAYVQPYLDEDLKAQVRTNSPRIRHMDYDWSLNDTARLR